MFLSGKASEVVVDVTRWRVVMIVLWTIGIGGWMDEGVHSLADSQDEEVGEVEDLVLAEEWSCVRARRLVADEADDLFLEF